MKRERSRSPTGAATAMTAQWKSPSERSTERDKLAMPGDTVLVHEGTYRESFEAEEAPVALPGGSFDVRFEDGCIIVDSDLPSGFTDSTADVVRGSELGRARFVDGGASGPHSTGRTLRRWVAAGLGVHLREAFPELFRTVPFATSPVT